MSKIQWTDVTWNPVRGCTKISPGCKNCYAETFAERWRGIAGHPYEQGFDLRLVPEKLDEPLKWKKPRRVFVNSMSDLFQKDVPFAFINQVFVVMALARRHTFQLLTKRPEGMRDAMAAIYRDVTQSPLASKTFGPSSDWPLPNVWLGVSVESQDYLGRIDILKDVPAAVRFVSFEPLLEDLGALVLDGIDWAIVGGESGPGARTFDIAWARSILKQCRAQATYGFVKQLGANVIESRWPKTERSFTNFGRVEQLKLKSRKGGDMSEWPSDLRVREFPIVGSKPCPLSGKGY